ncbi:N-acetylneuraminate lyase [Oceanicola granulosus HTCC2516]|uniref:N-acetylneuraminate lyase n=1 Tax=Oceanicola granulosus (strain ATCC BAA-861 / DSM 15982 / KCTC 12143 / HTCC2516) TaxID=314256 RepID=Q2CJ68_OCEGH|nr:dihydrodipicolinate synthase family protein [Oceanicola granulosus]EAR52732.1 N-acetylneuraminate lyase [Oceanicola granulosus HTCC2516]
MARFGIADFKGVIPALVTPFTLEGALDLTRARAITRHLLGQGVDCFYLTGSTGEGFMMSPDERKQMVETVLDEVAGSVPVMVHVGAISTYQTVDLATHAEGAGADAISSVPPIYWPFTPEQILSYYTDVTRSTALPMVVYKIPLAGALGFDLIERLAGIEGVSGIKYTAPTHFEIMQIRQQFGTGFRIFSGADEMALSGLAFGADGLIGSFYNIVPGLYAELVAAMAEGRLEEAQALQAKANKIIFFTLRQYPMAAVKRIMGWQGADAGYCRAPFENYETPEQEAALKDAFRALRDAEGLTGVDFLDAL